MNSLYEPSLNAKCLCAGNTSSKSSKKGLFVNTLLKGITTDHTLELNQREKERVFNLGYYTWVEQQGIDLNDFEKRRDQQFWRDHYNHILSLDERIEEFNAL